MGNSIKTVFVVIGALIGAGFASGQEIYVFFFSYGMKGIAGIVIASVFFGVVIYKTLKIINKYDIQDYHEFLEYIIPSKINKKVKKYIIEIINFIINLFILITFFIMIAGFGAYLNQNIGVPQIIGSSILAVLCLIILSKKTKGIVKVNEWLVPILIIFIIIIGVCSMQNIDFGQMQNYVVRSNNTNWIVSAILYTSYNSILLIPILISIRKLIKSEKIWKISILIFIITAILAISIFLGMVRIDVDISNLEMPISYVVSNTLPYLNFVYGIVILASILTSSVSLGEGLMQDVVRNDKERKYWLISICVASIPVSQIGFSSLINMMYPVFGYMGLIIFLLMFIKTTCQKIKKLV